MKYTLLIVFIIYMLIINIAAFVTMGLDKKKSIKRGWRIPERTLILIAFIGGAFGSLLGMSTFRHKTKHIKFLILIPLALLLHILILINLFL